jgi:hypothetical protein
MPISILKEYMTSPRVASPKKVTLQFWLPSFQSIISAALVFAIQIGISLGGVFLLYYFYHPQIPKNLQTEADWMIQWGPYPYFLIEIAIFLCASMIAIWISHWERKTKIILFAAEIGILLFVQLMSTTWGYACTTLISMSHFPIQGKPSCGMSSINISSFGFLLFMVATVSLWIFLLNTAAKRKTL